MSHRDQGWFFGAPNQVLASQGSGRFRHLAKQATTFSGESDTSGEKPEPFANLLVHMDFLSLKNTSQGHLFTGILRIRL